jgi:putative ABC transport system permease protein
VRRLRRANRPGGPTAPRLATTPRHAGPANAWRVARYRWSSSLRHSRGTLLAIALLTGLVGGTAIASLVTARETASSYATLLARSHPSDMNVSIQAPNISSRLARLPGVRHVETALYSLAVFPMGPHGAPIIPKAVADGDVATMGSISGEYFTQDRVSVVQGRLADPARADEFMATATAERDLGWHVGTTITMGFYTNAQTSSTAFGTARDKPAFVRREHLVGTYVSTESAVLDYVDRLPTWLLYTPAATRHMAGGVQYIQYALRLRKGASGVSAVEREIIEALPPGTPYTFHVTSVVSSAVDRSIRPEALALGVFGVMALLGAMLTALQLIARHLRRRRVDQAALRALGATTRAVVVDELAGVVGALVVGSVLAVAVAVALSPLSPIGPIAPLLSRHLHVDAGVVAAGAAALVVVTVLAALVLAVRWAPGRRPRRSWWPRVSGGSALARSGAAAGLPASAVAGLHFAFEPGRGRDTVPVRSVLTGVVLAVTMIGATLTFGSGLSTLVAHPALYGWSWSYAIGSDSDVPPQTTALLTKSPLVAAWTGVNFANAQIDGVTVPIILTPPHARVAPPLLSGHEVNGVDQVVLGAETLAQLHKKVGDTVVIGYGTKRDFPVYVPPTTATIVGAATLPAIGGNQALHTSMGVGAMIDVDIEPPAFRAVLKSPYPALNGPQAALVRLRPGVTHAQLVSLERATVRVAARAFAAVPNGNGGGDSVAWVGVQYPAEIINYRSIGDTPLWLAMGFASGVVVAFAMSVVASVRRRRRDLALLKTLGFTRRQLGAAIAWQATVSVVLGLVVGVPAGIVLGRWLWDLFAEQIYAVPRASVPALSLVLLAAGALILANVVAFVPSRTAARTRVGPALRAE